MLRVKDKISFIFQKHTCKKTFIKKPREFAQKVSIKDESHKNIEKLTLLRVKSTAAIAFHRLEFPTSVSFL